MVMDLASSSAAAPLTTANSNPNPNTAFLRFLSEHLNLLTPHVTLPSLISAAARRLRSPAAAPQLHAVAVKSTTTSSADQRHVSNSLIHLYASSGLLASALQLFDAMPEGDRDVVTWTSIISAAADSDRPDLALSLFDSMHVTPNDATIVSVLKACADCGALTVGRKAHCIATELGIASKPNITTTLIDMYSKCGRIDIAERIFERTAEKDLFSTSAMISGLASHGRSRDALELFARMPDMGLKPDEKTITAALSACRSSGWVAEGYKIYNNMRKFGLRPKIQHYGCMVDLLSRAGHLKAAEGFIKRMPIEPDSLLYRNLIWASRLRGDIDRAKRLVEETKHIELDSGSGDGYVLKGNVYASDKNWEAKARIRESMIAKGIKKHPGCSRIEVDGVLHEFEAGDRKHPARELIYRKWEEVAERLRKEGHRPKYDEALLDAEEEEKAAHLKHHSEKLALAFGLINARPGEQILIVKNLRACRDCHSAMKLASKVYERKIVVRDRIKFHHFQNGSCSCGDFW